jgi:hypothetical protein
MLQSHVEEYKQLVRDMVAEYGAQATYIRNLGDGAYDPATGVNTQLPAEIPIQAIVMELTLQSNGQQLVNGKMIQWGDKVMYVIPTEGMLPVLQPEAGFIVEGYDDSVRVGTVVYKVVTMKVVDPTMVNAIMYELYVRR